MAPSSGSADQMSNPRPVTMISSATPGVPVSVAKTTRWPLRVNTLQLTATSVGSKSRSGIGMRTVATAPRRLRHFQFEADVVVHPAAQLAEEVEHLADDAVALADRVVNGGRLRLVENGRRSLDGLAGRAAVHGAGGQRDPRGVADSLDLPRLFLGDDQEPVPSLFVQGGPDGRWLGLAVLGERSQQDVLRLGEIGEGRCHQHNLPPPLGVDISTPYCDSHGT